MNLNGNTILITGGSRGIGLEMARRFSSMDNRVIITGRDENHLAEAASTIPNLIPIQSDVSDSQQIAKLAERVNSEFPETNVLINNAGVMWRVNLQQHEMSLEEMAKEIDINFKGPVQMVDAFLPQLLNVSNAAIVNVSSALAYVPFPISAIYSATKAALHSYTQSLRIQLSNTDVKVFELIPPATATDLLSPFADSDGKGFKVMKSEDMVDRFIKGLAKDQLEIRPGQTNQLRIMSRLAPQFILKKLGQSVKSMHRDLGSD